MPVTKTKGITRTKPIAKPAGARPTGTSPTCPPPGEIDAALTKLGQFFGVTSDSDARASALQSLIGIPAGCLSHAQAATLLKYSSQVQHQAAGESASLGGNIHPTAALSLLGKIPAFLKIAAGGIGIAISGLALVYVAGRNTSGGAALKGATGAAVKVAPAPVKVAAKVASKAAPERSQARTFARQTRERNRTANARARVVTDQTKRGGSKTRVIKRSAIETGEPHTGTLNRSRIGESSGISPKRRPAIRDRA